MSPKQFSMDDYNDVAARIAEFREKHENGSLQQVSVDFKEVNGGWWVVYTAAAYRHEDDKRPGHGTAWEPIPGRTPYTKDSEVQNAETAAWGRAIVAALAADTRKGVASAEEVRNRRPEVAPPPPPSLDELLMDAQQANSGPALDALARRVKAVHDAGHLSAAEFTTLRDVVTARRAEIANPQTPPPADGSQPSRRRADTEGSAA